MNTRFSDYVTSGAFHLSLTRNQISALALTAVGDGGYAHADALERKGLCQRVPAAYGDGEEVRLTAAGALCLSLLAEAGLTNNGASALAAEVESLARELAAARKMVRDSALRARSAFARKDEAERRVAELERALSAAQSNIRLKDDVPHNHKPVIMLKDPLPDLSDEEVMAGIARAEGRSEGAQDV